MTEKKFDYIAILVLWMLVLVSVIYLRPILPMDETRYFSVAWSMWQDGNWLVPTLNGETYSHKPPLLFWLINFGWHLFGVVEWWPRVIAPCFGLGCIFVIYKLSGLLWPHDELASRLSPLILFGFLFWMLFGTLTMFDTILAFFSLITLSGIIFAWRTGRWAGFIIAGAALGLGILAKGPAIFVHVFPVALSAPWWGSRLINNSIQFSNQKWYKGVVIMLFLSAFIALSWAIPAGIEGGAEYREAIFWGQSTGRLVESFAHARPFWWFMVWIIPLLLPWVFWPQVWRGFLTVFRHVDGAVLFCSIWFGSAFIVFSIISGKQLHYLLPEFPAIALLIARGLSILGDRNIGRRERFKTAAIFIFLSLVILAVSTEEFFLLAFDGPKYFLSDSNTNWAILILIVGVSIVIPRSLNTANTILLLTTASAVTVVTVHLMASDILAKRYDLRLLSLELKRLQGQGYAIANANKYHGQFDFLGRLDKPIWIVGQRNNDLTKFLEQNKRTRIVVYYAKVPSAATPLSFYNFRKYIVAILDGRDVALNPELLNRN